MLVITAERVPHDTGTVLSAEFPTCVSVIVFGGMFVGQVKPDPAHEVVTVKPALLMAHV